MSGFAAFRHLLRSAFSFDRYPVQFECDFTLHRSPVPYQFGLDLPVSFLEQLYLTRFGSGRVMHIPVCALFVCVFFFFSSSRPQW